LINSSNLEVDDVSFQIAFVQDKHKVLKLIYFPFTFPRMAKILPNLSHYQAEVRQQLNTIAEVTKVKKKDFHICFIEIFKASATLIIGLQFPEHWKENR
jgi:hypothetical protein